MADLTGQTLGRYEIQERLGQGGMAEVYKAYQSALDRTVAIKVLHSFLLDQPDSRARFAREARSVAALRHPHIVQVIDFDVIGDTYFMVMELLPGPTLRQVLDAEMRAGTRLALPRVGEILTAIGGALGYAHEQGLIHRDIKPQNILFTAQGQPVLTDFGIAKLLSGANPSGSGLWTGTPAYMSPEQGRGGPLDIRTDLYSLGVVLYELLTGQVPFRAETPFGVVLQHINEPPPAPRRWVPTLSPQVEQVVLTALAKAPPERYPTAAAFVAAFQAALVSTPPLGLEPAGGGRASAPAIEPNTLGGQLSGLRKLLGLSQAQVAGWIQGPHDDAPPVERIQHWEHNRRRPRTRRELLTIARELHKLNPVVITPERIEQLLHAYDPLIPLTAEERTALGLVEPVSSDGPAAAEASSSAQPSSPQPTREPMPVLSAKDADADLPPNPYRGLFAFQEADAPFFCGRARFTTALLAAVHERSLVAVLGPSGSGKSSLVFAGVLPPLRTSGEWQVAATRPGDRPFHSLAAVLIPLLEGPTSLTETDRLVEINKLAERLIGGAVRLQDVAYRIVEKAPPGGRILLVLDQFEEVYTLVPNADLRARFLDCLVSAVRAEWPRRTPAFTLLLTLRADFLSHVLTDRALADVLQEADLKLGPMTRAELQTAIEEPAVQLGVQIEDGLTERILAAVSSEPGDLPLLEFALSLLWEQQQERTLTHEAYDAIGGVEQALAGYAEQVYSELNAADHERAVRIFTQLVRPGEGTADTRRLATRDEVGEENWDLVKQLADARLVVTGRDAARRNDTVEVVHEALIENWVRLREWVERDRQFRIWQERLRGHVQQWLDSKKDAGALLRGGPLSEAATWLEARTKDLSSDERDYLAASVAEQERQTQIEHAQQIREAALQRRATSRLQALVGVLGLFLVAAVILTGLTYNQRQIAEYQALVNRAQTLVAQASSQDRNPELGILLALEAISTTQRVAQPALPGAVAALHLEISRSQMRLTLRGHTGSVNYASYSPDGRWIVTASGDHTAKVSDAHTGQLHLTLAGHTAEVWCANYSPDGRYIVTASDDQSAKIWDANTGRMLLTIGGNDVDNAGNYAEFSADGRRILTASGQRAGVWDATTGQRLLELRGHTDWLSSAAYSPDGTRIVTAGGGDSLAKIWDATTGQDLLTLRGHNGGVISAVFSADGKHVLTASNDGTARIWDAATGQELMALKGHANNVLRANYSPDGRTIVTASADKTVILWDAATGLPRLTLHGHDDVVFSAVFSPDGLAVLTASLDQTAKVWELALSQERPNLIGHTDGITGITYSPDNRQIATSSKDTTAKVWEAATGRELLTLQGHANSVNGLAYSPDGRWLATASSDGTAKVWDANTGQELLTLQGHSNIVNGVAWSPDGRSLATSSSDGTAKIWDAATGQERWTLKGHTAQVWSVAWSPDGQSVVTAGNDHLVKIWEAATGRLLRTLQGHTDRVMSAAYSPDGRWIVTTSNDTTAKIWDASSGQERTTFHGHAGLVYSAIFSPDGTQVVTASDDGTAKLWDAAHGVLQASLLGHEAGVVAVAYSRDGRFIATASDDGTARQYYAHLDDLLSLAATRVSRTLTTVERATYLGEALPIPTPAPTVAATP